MTSRSTRAIHATACARSHATWVGVAHGPDPAPHRGQWAVELGGDPPVPGTGRAGLHRRPDHRGGVNPPGRHHRGQHVRGPAGVAAGASWS